MVRRISAEARRRFLVHFLCDYVSGFPLIWLGVADFLIQIKSGRESSQQCLLSRLDIYFSFNFFLFPYFYAYQNFSNRDSDCNLL